MSKIHVTNELEPREPTAHPKYPPRPATATHVPVFEIVDEDEEEDGSSREQVKPNHA